MMLYLWSICNILFIIHKTCLNTANTMTYNIGHLHLTCILTNFKRQWNFILSQKPLYSVTIPIEVQKIDYMTVSSNLIIGAVHLLFYSYKWNCTKTSEIFFSLKKTGNRSEKFSYSHSAYNVCHYIVIIKLMYIWFLLYRYKLILMYNNLPIRHRSPSNPVPVQSQ